MYGILLRIGPKDFFNHCLAEMSMFAVSSEPDCYGSFSVAVHFLVPGVIFLFCGSFSSTPGDLFVVI